MRGREHPIVLPDALHTAHTYYVRASVPQCSSLCIRFPQRDAYPSGCDGNRTRYGLLAKPWPVDLRPHPTIFFWLGNRRPSGGRTDALCWPGASGSRGARPEPSFVSVITS